MSTSGSRPRVTGKAKVAQLKRIAMDAVQGVSREVTAAREGISVASVSNERHDPRTQTFISRFKQANEEQLARMMLKALKSTEERLEHALPEVQEKAVDQTLKIATAGDNAQRTDVAVPADGGSFELTELLLSFRQVKVEGQ